MADIDEFRSRWHAEPYKSLRTTLLLGNSSGIASDLRGIAFAGETIRHLSFAELTDLSYADLSNLNLSSGTFRKVNLTNADMRGAVIDTCNFNGANLQHIEATGTTFSNCNFERAKMQGGTLLSATFNRCSLKNASFEADGTGARTVLQKTVFSTCDLWGTRFSESMLMDCQFIDCLFYQLQNVDWTLNRISSEGAYVGPDRTDEYFQPFDNDITFEDFFALQGSITRWYKVPKVSRTAVMQHLLYFKKYVEHTKGIDFTVDSISRGRKVGIRISSRDSRNLSGSSGNRVGDLRG